MTYNEWKDELKSNLLSVSAEERRRVCDYYAEAYADRREAGFSEREIIEEFGAPYDAAQRILCERDEGEEAQTREKGDFEKKTDNGRDTFFDPPEREEAGQEKPRREKPQKAEREASSVAGTLLFVLLCVVLWAPIFSMFMVCFGITVALGVLPVALLAGGVGSFCATIAALTGGAGIAALTAFGTGLAAIGSGLILFPLCIKGISLLWQAVKSIFGAIRSLLSGRRKA